MQINPTYTPIVNRTLKTNIYIDISPRQASQNVIDKLKRAYPDESGERYFQCDLFENDPRLKRVWEILLENGLAPRDQLKQNEIPFCFEMERVYNASELRAATYLTPWARNEFDVEYRDEQKRILLNRQHIKRDRQAGFATMSMIVSLALKQKLESAGFLNLVFLPVCLDEKPTDQWWEMTSEIRLPPVAPPCEVMYFRGGKPFDGDYSQSLILREGFYQWPELHYRQSEIKPLEPFYCARSIEGFAVVEYDRLFVISNRLYRFLEAEKARLKWTPVRINQD